MVLRVYVVVGLQSKSIKISGLSPLNTCKNDTRYKHSKSGLNASKINGMR